MTAIVSNHRVVDDFLSDSAARFPDKVALVCGARRLTFREIDECANRVAGALRDRGIRRGDRVMLCQSNCVEAVVGIFAILKAGGAFVFVNPHVTESRLSLIANDCEAVALLFNGRGAASRLGAAALRNAPSLRLLVDCGPATAVPDRDSRWTGFDRLLDGPSGPRSSRELEPEVTCLIYTSGTTGEPKGVICDHRSVTFVAASIGQYLECSETDTVLNVLPLSFTYGLYQLFTTFMAGGTLVLENSFAFPLAIVQAMARERVTAFAGVPTIYSMLLRLDLSGFDLSRLRYLTNAAAALSPEQVLEIRRRFPQATFYSMYGQTETARSLYLPPHLVEEKPGSVGIAIPGTEAWIEDESGQRVGAETVGELVVRGRHVMRGYWGDDAATAARFFAGRSPDERVFRTGDLFKADRQGHFYFVSRKDDVIKTRGEKVAPREVENVLHRLKGVVAAAVVGVPDAVLGQAVKAVMTTDRPLTAVDVQTHCRAHLEEFMVPRYVEFRDALPMTMTGKIKRNELG